jgi:hypothetical protein
VDEYHTAARLIGKDRLMPIVTAAGSLEAPRTFQEVLFDMITALIILRR